MKHAFAALTLCLLWALPAAAQPLRGPVLRERTQIARGAVPVDDANAQETLHRLQEMLQQYPPSLGRVLALDPTLLNDGAYLQPYPQLAALVAQRPDIIHNPAFYFDQQLRDLNRRNGDWNEPRAQAIRAIDEALGGLAVMIVGLTIIYTITWVIRTVIQHRKWLRMSKTHIDTHAKLMDRLTSSEDLIAYMESPAGRKFLEAAPIPLDSGPKTLNAPFGRILWSMQAGVVVAALGGGLVYASMRIADSAVYSDGSVPLLVIGIAALAIGGGFFVSAIAAWILSSRLGLFPGRTTTDSGATHVS